MNYFQKLVVKSAAKIVGKTGGDAFFHPFGSTLIWDKGEKKIYENTAVLFAVINKRAQCFGSAVSYVMDKQGNEVKTPQAEQIRKLLEQPNSLMSWSQFYALLEICRMLYGYCIVLKSSFAPGQLPTALYIADPSHISLRYRHSANPYIGRSQEVEVHVCGSKTSLTLDDLIIFNDVKLGFGDNIFLAQSRMTAIENENKLLAVLSDAEHAIIRNRGALGIISKDVNEKMNAEVFKEDVEPVHEAYRRYGINSEHWHVLITNLALRWQAITPPLKDLQLLEFEEQMAKKICGVFDVPFALFPFHKENSLGNGGADYQQEKRFYQSTVIPSAKGDAVLLTKSLCRGHDLTITLDFSDVAALQEDLKTKAEGVNTIVSALTTALDRGAITRDECRSILSEYVAIDPAAQLEEQKIMLAAQLGVGGLQGFIALLTDAVLSSEQKRAALVELFNRTPEQALALMPNAAPIVTPKPIPTNV
jgi:phage portal protein BeeE